MAKKKKGTGDPILDVMMEMLDGLSPEQQMQLMDRLGAFEQSGKSMADIERDLYTYQRPDYSRTVKPLAEYLAPLKNAAKPSEALAAYAQIHKAMESRSQQEREDDLRNFVMCVLADGLKGNFGWVEDASCLPLFVVFQLVDDYKMMGLFDVLLETLKQAPDFYEFYYSVYEDVVTLMLAHVGVGHLEELKEMMNTDGFVPEVYPTIFNAVVQMAVENPVCRLQVLAWVSDVLKSCADTTIPPMAMDWCVKSLAQIKAAELLPLIKDIYKEYKVPKVEIKDGIRGVTRLLTKGTDERIVGFSDFREVLDLLLQGEKNDYQLPAEGDDDWIRNLFGAVEEDKRDADALFYEECNRSKKKSKKGKRKYALTLNVTLKDSPRKVFRQLTVPSDLRLDRMGKALMGAMGWDGYHLDQFIKGKDCYLLPDERDNGLEWGEDARDYTIGDLLDKVGAKVVWEYDFGDSWEHEVALVEKVELAPSEDIPVKLLKGTGACPPEDCGGVHGYRHLLNVLKDPDHEEYEEMKEWLGGDFDPKKFSTVKARWRIKAYLADEEMY